MNLNALRDAAYTNAKEKGFHETPRSIPESIALMHSELSEALEDHRTNKLPNDTWYEATEETMPFRKPCGIPSEMADVILRVLDFCGQHNIDIDKAVTEKMAYNKTRPTKHGKRY